MPWDDARLNQTERAALDCTSEDACTTDVVLLIGEVRRQRQALSDIQFNLINCHQAAARDACEHLKDAIKIVNRSLQQADSRSLNENCRCGRSLLFPGDADPWCAGCNMSAATCDCADAEPRAALAYEYP